MLISHSFSSEPNKDRVQAQCDRARDHKESFIRFVWMKLDKLNTHTHAERSDKLGIKRTNDVREAKGWEAGGKYEHTQKTEWKRKGETGDKRETAFSKIASLSDPFGLVEMYQWRKRKKKQNTHTHKSAVVHTHTQIYARAATGQQLENKNNHITQNININLSRKHRQYSYKDE